MNTKKETLILNSKKKEYNYLADPEDSGTNYQCRNQMDCRSY